ncbi:hypothetical protein PVAND_001968 [Polypedilum vanderplanki]|uniref:Renin receptor n=1 Tax=Polypedilum vanderplanki TaxID=319348 RepID=A0A9J6BQ01_POLVA|nr:hypothetical protein PVAND_001968 [Polypedilum vanderplanki]
MEKIILLVFSLISLASCNDFIVLSSPKSISFKGSNDLPSQAISEVFAASLGYSVYSTEPWTGLYVNNPLETAKTVVSFVVEGADDLNFDNAKSFKVTGDDMFFEQTIHQKVLEHSHLAVDIDLANREEELVVTSIGDVEKSTLSVKLQYLNSKNKGDKDFLDQISYLNGLKDIIANLNTQPAYINVRLSLNSLSKSDSTRTEAIKLLRSTLNKLNDAIQKAYNGNALVTVITVESHQIHSRSKREIVENDEENKYNLATLRSSDYPVIFNIVFWFTIILLFSLIAISLALSNVEDKDSIIYRMTGARGKKDN